MVFNGQSFTKITDSSRVPVTAVTSHNGGIVLGYANGKIAEVKNFSVKQSIVNNGPGTVINSIYIDKANFIWLASEEGISMLFNNNAINITTHNGLSDNYTYTICPEGPYRMLAGSDKGINDIQFTDKPVIDHVTTLQGLPDNIVRVIKKITGTSYYLIGTQAGGIALYNTRNKKITLLKLNCSWVWGQVNDILPISKNRAWIATDDGYLIEATLSDTSATLKDHYFPGKKFRKLVQDRSGNIWCATNQGVTLITSEYLSYIKLSLPYLLRDATAMIWKNDTLWLAQKEQLYEIPLGTEEPKMIPVYKTPSPITSLYFDQTGRLWIGTWGDGLFYKNGNEKSLVKATPPELNNNSILNIAGTNSAIWIAGLNGVDELWFVKNKLTLYKHHSKHSGIGSDYVYQLYPDRKGNMWMATDGAGVCMYDGDKYHHWSSFSKNNVAYSITEDVYGDIWAGTLYKNLYHLHNNNWQNYRAHETQYPDINISTVIANATGQVISVYQKCIDEWYPESNYYRHFNSALGVGIDSTSNVLNCAAKDKYGNVYIPSQKGILMFRNQDKVYDIRPAVHISHIFADLKPVIEGQNKFTYDENYISFYFDGINFTNRERLNYRYILEGYNNDWTKTSDVVVNFTKLPPGQYKFRVQSSLNPFFDHANEDRYSFTISAPFWRTIWFYALVILLFVSLVYLYISVREKRILKLSTLKQDRIMFEYEHLKSQVNPHFLFNSLNTLTDLIEENKENAIDYTIHLSDLYRNTLSYINKDLILLAEENEILTNYIHIQKSRFGNAVHVNVNIPQSIMETKRIVPLALQLLVENAIKHNVVSVALPLTIHIDINEKEITVRNQIHAKISREKRTGLGLINIKNRYALVTKRPVVFGICENEYIVTLPLL